jgi:hypothetical protein
MLRAAADDREGLGDDAVAGERAAAVLLAARGMNHRVPALWPAACRWLSMPASVDRG